MLKGKDQVTPAQVAIGLVSTMVGVEILAMPRNLANAAGRDGWMSIILAGIIVGSLIYLFTVLGRRFPGKSIVEYSQEIMGKPLGILIILTLWAFYILVAAYVVREFGDILKLYLLDNTPVEIIILCMLFVCAYLVNHGVNSLLRIMQVFFPLLIISLSLLFMMVMPLINLKELLPPFQEGIMPVLKGVVSGFAIFGGFSVIAFFIPFMKEPQKATRACLLAQGLVIGLYLVLFIQALGAFGPVELTQILYPVNDLVRGIEVPGTIIERFDIIILSLWILAAFTTIAALYYVSVFSLGQLMGLKELPSLSYLTLPLIYLVAMRPQDIIALQDLGMVINYVNMGISLLIPMLFIIAIFRGKGGTA